MLGMNPEDLILCRATVKQSSNREALKPGWVYWLDGTDPVIRGRLADGWLVHEVELEAESDAADALDELDEQIAALDQPARRLNNDDEDDGA